MAATLSINNWFGSGYMILGTGVLLNDEMDDFSVPGACSICMARREEKPNEIAPRKRPL